MSKIFNVQDNNCIDEIRCCDVPGVHVMIERRRMRFVEKLLADEQLSFYLKYDGVDGFYVNVCACSCVCMYVLPDF